MAKKKTSAAVLVSNFQPYHNGHKSMVDFALSKHDYVLMFLRERLGPPRSKASPWLYNERVDMILAAHPADEHRIYFSPLVDDPDEEAWAKSLEQRAACIAPPDSELTYIGKSPIGKLKFLAFVMEGRSGSEIIADYLKPTGSFEAAVQKDVPSTTLARMQQVIDGRTLEGLRR
jgi:cytidyltransferase-like protein